MNEIGSEITIPDEPTSPTNLFRVVDQTGGSGLLQSDRIKNRRVPAAIGQGFELFEPRIHSVIIDYAMTIIRTLLKLAKIV